jgi:stage V sporulation protein SpoVS
MMMNSGVISWKSKLQTVVANSTTDAEVYAATLAIKEVIYLRDALRRIGLPQAIESAPHIGTKLYEDNEATVSIACTAAHREATKHMAIARAFLCYHHENGTVCITNCFTDMQVADFLTKSLGPKIHHKLIDEAMGVNAMMNITRFSRRDWKRIYDEQHVQKINENANDVMSVSQDVDTEKMIINVKWMRHIDHCNVLPDDTQGGMLKSRLIDIVNLNCMRIPSHEEAMCVVCDTIEEYIRYEQHRLNVVNQITTEDMKAENKYYGNVIQLNHMSVPKMF